MSGSQAQKALRARYSKVTDVEIERFFEVLAKNGGVKTAAAKEVRPEATHGKWGYRVFERLYSESLEFRDRVHAAIEEANDGIRKEVWRRAVEGEERFVVQGGEVVSHPVTGEPLTITQRSDKMLELLTRRLPELKNSSEQLIRVERQDAEAQRLYLSPSDFMRLDPHDRSQLASILKKLQAARVADDRVNAEVIDAVVVDRPKLMHSTVEIEEEEIDDEAWLEQEKAALE